MRKHLLLVGFASLVLATFYSIWAVFSDFAQLQRDKEIARSLNEKTIARNQSSKWQRQLVKAQDVKTCMEDLGTEELSQDVRECLVDHYIEVRLNNNQTSKVD